MDMWTGSAPMIPWTILACTLVLVALGVGAGVWRTRRGRRLYAPTLFVPGVPTLREAMPAIERELARARRYEHPAAVLALEVNPEDVENLRQALVGGNGATASGFERLQVRNVLQARLATMLGADLRTSDIAALGARNDIFYVLLPEAGRAGAEAFAKRLEAAFRAATGASLAVGVAQFPDEELVVRELLSRAEAARGVASSPAAQRRPADASGEARTSRRIERVVREGAGSS